MSESVLHLFRSLLNEGFKRISIHVSLPVQAYMRELLISYIPSNRLFDEDKDSGQKNLKSLAELYLKAQKVSFNEKRILLQQVGDRSLYLGGFFREALNKRLVNLNYYMNIGKSAYGHLAEDHPQEDMFRELSYFFSDLMDVLSYISQKNSIRTDQDLLKLCKHYLRTGSKISRYQLEDHGFSLQENDHTH